MKRLLILTALLPFVGFAQPINTLNNPNQPGYQIPSQQRMQTQMQTQQIQQKGMLNQQLKTQTQLQQQHLENQTHEISTFAENNSITIDKWVEETISSRKPLNERKLGSLLKKLKKDDILIATELSRL